MGQVRQVANKATAWNNRDATWAMVIVGVDPNPANREKIVTWAKEYWKAVHPYSSRGAYVNFMMDVSEERIRATYGDNYEKLVAIKNKYHPTNLFKVNQNIKPSVKKSSAQQHA